MAGAAALLGVGGWARVIAAPYLRAPEALTHADQDRLDKAASASLFGELRGGFGDYLWLKADRILHNGVDMRGLTAAEQRGHLRWHATHARGEEGKGNRAHADETTVVPNLEADRRGILGEIERQVKPYMDMRNHRHRDVADTMSLFRLMTWANPHFIPGWVVGAEILAGRLNPPNEALAFLLEGEKQNPESPAIQTEIGRYLLYRCHDAPAAEQRFRRAMALGSAQPSLSSDEEEGWENAHRWLLIEYYRLGRHSDACAVARVAPSIVSPTSATSPAPSGGIKDPTRRPPGCRTRSSPAPGLTSRAGRRPPSHRSRASGANSTYGSVKIPLIVGRTLVGSRERHHLNMPVYKRYGACPA